MGRLLPRSLRLMQEIVPPLAPHYGRLPEVLPAEGKRRARVALFTGCAADAFFPQTNLGTARVLQRNGCEVWIPRTQVCCGALHYHAGLVKQAERLAADNCTAFGKGLEDGLEKVDAIINNAGGCGPVLKEYGHLLEKTPAAGVGAAFAVESTRHQRVSGGTRPREADAPAADQGDVSRRLRPEPRPEDPPAAAPAARR